MRKVIVILTDEEGEEMRFEKVRRKGRYVFEAELPQINFCPYCGGTNLKRSPIICKDCGKGIGVISRGKWRISGNPFKNWRISPVSGRLIRKVKTQRCSGP